MARPPSIRDEDLLDAALEVLRERGLSCTTAEIAARAGVSEGTLFNRFKSKHELLASAIRRGADFDPPWVRGLEKRVGKGDVFEQLAEVAEEGLAFFSELVPMITLAASTPHESGMADHLASPDSPPIRTTRQLSRYLEAEMRLGRLARHDAEVVARTILGAVYNFAFLDYIQRGTAVMPMPSGTFVRGFIQLLRGGLAPTATTAAPPTGPKRAPPTRS